MAAAWSALAWAAPEVAVVVSDDSAAYREVAEALRAELQRDAAAPVSVRVLPASAAASLSRNGPQGVVAVGTRAARAVAARELKVPVLNTLVPRSTFERIAAGSGRGTDTRRFSAVYLDQPLGRQLELIRAALPDAATVGLLLGPESGSLLPAVQAAATDRHLGVVAQTVSAEGEVYPALQRLLGEADILLALPDPVVYNSGTIPHILLALYRNRIPVFGFSAAYTRAGAVLALHSTPAQIGSQAAEMLRRALATGQLPPPQHPREFTVSTNPHVARSLGLTIDDEATLTLKLMLREAQ